MSRAKTKRQRWHEPHALEACRKHLKSIAGERKDALTRIMDGVKLDPEVRRVFSMGHALSVHIVRECDLRATLEEKSLSTHDFASWTAFVNRAGTLIHVLPQEGDFHIRLPLYHTVKHAPDKYIENLVKLQFGDRLKS